MENRYSEAMKSALKPVVKKIEENPDNKNRNKKLFVKVAAAFVVATNLLTGCGSPKSVDEFRASIETIKTNYRDGVRDDFEVKNAQMFKDDLDKRVEQMKNNGENKDMNKIDEYNLLTLYQGTIMGYLDLYDSENFTVVANSNLNLSALNGNDEFYASLSEAIVSQDLANEISDSLTHIDISGFDSSTEGIVDGYVKDTAKQEEKVDDLVEKYMKTFNVAPENMDNAKQEFRDAIAKWTIKKDGKLGDFLKKNVTIFAWPNKAVDFFNDIGGSLVEGANTKIVAFNSWSVDKKYGQEDEKNEASTTSSSNGNGNGNGNPVTDALHAVAGAANNAAAERNAQNTMNEIGKTAEQAEDYREKAEAAGDRGDYANEEYYTEKAEEATNEVYGLVNDYNETYEENVTGRYEVYGLEQDDGFEP